MSFGARVLVIAAGLVLSTSLVAAEPRAAEADADADADAASVDEARAEFKRGAELARAQRWDEARAAFERSYRLKPHPVTTYNIAYCERAVGHPARALRGFEQALVEHQARLGGGLPPHLVALAAQYRDEVAKRVARVELVVPEGARVSIDGAPLDAASARGVLLLDPRPHVFVVTKPGFATAVLSRDFADGQQARLEVPLEPRGAPVRGDASPQAGIDRRWSYVALGAGVASLVAAGAAGSFALRKRALLDDKCGASRADCPKNQQGDIDALGLYADTATIAALIGVAGLATGTALYFSATPKTRSDATAAAGWSVAMGGRF